MNAYSNKLRDPKWEQFRRWVFQNKGFACETCGGEDKPADDRNHIHHKRYFRDREPWEYDLEDVTVLCKECHDEIHECETSWRNFIRSLPSHKITEFQSLVDELERLDAYGAETVAAHAKNEARKIFHCGPETSSEPFSMQEYFEGLLRRIGGRDGR